MRIGLRGSVVTYDISHHDTLISITYHLLHITFPIFFLGSTQEAPAKEECVIVLAAVLPRTPAHSGVVAGALVVVEAVADNEPPHPPLPLRDINTPGVLPRASSAIRTLA